MSATRSNVVRLLARYTGPCGVDPNTSHPSRNRVAHAAANVIASSGASFTGGMYRQLGRALRQSRPSVPLFF
jgi:hypothetical protein